MEWFDSYGFLHDKPVNEDDAETSENGPLFTAVYLALKKLNGENVHLHINERLSSYGIISILKRNPRPTPISKMGAHISYDNVLGIYAFYKMSSRWEGTKKRLPSLWWLSEDKVYIRAESIFLMYAKYNWFKFATLGLVYPYFMAAMILSAFRAPEHMGGTQKWFLRASLFLPSAYMKMLKLVLKWQGLNLYNVFYDYYKTYNPNPDDHLSVVQAQRLLIKGEF